MAKVIRCFKRQEGFTLIELLVVIAIIALLLSVIVPSLKKAKMYAEEIVCKNNLHQYGLATEMYLMENNDGFPHPWLSLYDTGTSSLSFPGELQRYCRWHNPDYNLESHPEYAGPYWPYLATTKANICPTFSKVAKRYGQDHPYHNEDIDRIEVQFSYSMNGIFYQADRNQTAKRSQVSSQSQTFLWAEENMWLLNGLSSYVLNDNALVIPEDTGSPIDTFASFHKVSISKLGIQQSSHEYDTGMGNVLMLDGSLSMLPPTESSKYRGKVR